MLKIKNKNLNLVIVFPIEVGELKVIAETQVWIHKDDDGNNKADTDFADISDITYMGIPINGYDNWRKFREFHKEMGIDFDKAIDAKYREVITEEAINELIKDLKF